MSYAKDNKSIMESMGALKCLLDAARQPRPYTTIGRTPEEHREIEADRDYHTRKEA